MLNLKELKNIYPNEQVLIILLTRFYFSKSSEIEINEFIQDHFINWEKLYKIAKAHSIRPFVYHTLDRFSFKVQQTIKDKLAKDNQIAMFNNMKLSGKIATLLSDFRELNIKVIAYKGPTVVHNYYINSALREGIDIDFIVDKKDVAKIEDYFIKKGYIAKETVPRSYLSFFKYFFKDMVYVAPIGNISIEIHWSLLDKFAGKFPTYPFFKNHTIDYTFNTLNITKLKPEYDLLVLISNHFVKDMFVKFKYMIDIACVLQKEPSLLQKQPFILAQAEKYHFKKRYNLGLSLVENLIGIGNPIEIKTREKDLLSVPLAFPISISRFQFNETKFLKNALKLQDNWFEKIKLIIRSTCYVFIPSNVDINTFNLPIYLSPLLIFLRPLRLLYLKLKKH